MCFLIGTQGALVLWEDGQKHVLHEGLGAYYGITWDDHRLYVVARGNKPSRMLVFDDTLYRLEDLPFADMGAQGYSGPHQALYSGGILYVVNTQYNRVECWDGTKVFSLSWGPTDGDHDHINSIWRESEAGTLWIIEHRKRKQEKRIRILQPDHALLRTIKLDLGDQAIGPRSGIHNVYIEDGTLYTLGPSHVVTYDLDTGDVGEKLLHGVFDEHYLRGLARCDDFFYIGVSRANPRKDRSWGESQILVTNAQFEIMERIPLPASYGQVFEIRLVDRADHAHNGIPCPLI